LKTQLHRFIVIVVLIACSIALFGQKPVRAQGGRLRWSIEGVSELGSLDPVRATDSQSFLVIDFLYGKLVKLDKLLKVTPDLAEKWQISSDGLTYTFPLKDVKFSDGSQITADDVVFSLNYAFDPNVGGSNASYYLSSIVGVEDFVSGKTKEIAGVTALDPKTVQIKINQQSAVFLNQLTFGFRVVSKKQVTEDKNWAENPVTSGGFMVKEWKHNQSITIAPNAGYWNKPSIDEIEFPFNKESETAYQLYRTGQLDIMGSQQNGVPVAHLSEVQGTPDFLQASGFATRFVGFNNAIPPFDNVKVRQAFALAIDKKTLAEKALAGAVVAADRILPQGIPGSELPIKPLAFDTNAAKQALADSGFTPQSLPPIKITYGIEGDNERVLTFLQAMWKENLGVEVQLDGMELAKFSDTLNILYKDPKSGVMQMYYSIWGADYPDPQNFLSQQLRTDVGNNNGHWSNKAFDELVDKADILTDDDTTRYQLYQEAEQLAISEVGWLPIFYPRINVLLEPGTEGFELTGNGLIVPDYSKIKPAP
jgi:oligopeptide transport system substrate-binding protein